MIITTDTLLLTLFFTLVAWYMVFLYQRRRLYKLAAQYDGPTPLPIIGNALTALVPLSDITENIISGCLYYKSPTKLWFGPKLTIYIWDPENARIVLNSPHALEKEPYLYKLVENISGHGLITSPVHEWKRHRKLIAPIFNQKCIEGFFDIFSCHSRKLVKNIQGMADKGIFDMHEHLVKYAMDTVMDTILDFTEDSGSSIDTRKVVSWFQNIMGAYTERMTNIWYFFDFIFNLSPAGKRLRRNKQEFDKFIASLIKKWEEDSLHGRSTFNETTDKEEFHKPQKLMDHLLMISDGKGRFTADELHGEVNNIIAAGLETTSSSIGFMLLLLAMNPEIQEKAYQEIVQVLGTETQLDYECIRNLEYLERIVKESLRIYPGIVGLGRFTDQEVQLTNHVIPANTSVIIGVVGIHRDPSIWPNPTKFDPDRFHPDEEAKRHPYSWIPFSAGSRNCVGLRFADISLKTVVATILLNYKISTDYKNVEDIPLTMMTVFKPTNGYKISITSR